MYDLVKHKFEELQAMEEREPVIVLDGNPRDSRYNVPAIVLLLALYCASLSLIIYGATHLKDCPAEKMVAISLIVIGGLSLLSRLISSPYEWREALGETDVQKNICLLLINALLQFVIIGWFIALCCWILKMDPDTKPEDHDAPNYCASEFYRNIYWGSIAGLAIFGLVLIASCGAGCYIASKI